MLSIANATIVALSLAADRPIGAVRLGAGFPEGASVSASLQAVPYVEVEAGAGVGFFFVNAYGRAGPSWLWDDRDQDGAGGTWRLSLLAGYRGVRGWESEMIGPELAGAVERAWWFSESASFSLRLASGVFWAFYDGPRSQVVPGLALQLGVGF